MPDITNITAMALIPNGSTNVALRDVRATVRAVKTSAGVLVGIAIVNNQSATAWVQVFNKAIADVTLTTDKPVLEFQVAANTSLYPALPIFGVAFTSAISVASTTTEAGNTLSATGVHVFSQIF